MDTNLLRSWLGLPAGPWPPDDRTLLGLTPVDTGAMAERKAMALMGRLRSHQLVHPELVTEGMNKLAQALLAVSAAADAAPDVPDAPEAFDFGGVVMELPPGGVVPQVEVASVKDATVVKADAKPTPKVTAAPRPVATAPVIHVEIPAATVPEPEIGQQPAARRDAYRELAGLRAVTRAWDLLKPFVAIPSAMLLQPSDVLEYLEATQALRAALAHDGVRADAIRSDAPYVTAVVGESLVLAVFRALTPSQRQVLARDWAIARGIFAARADAIRSALARTRKPPETGGLTGLGIIFGANPEWVLGVATVVVLVLAAVRTLTRPAP